VIFGGEVLELRSLKPWYECYGDENPKLINMYGITETTVHVTYRPITRADIDCGAGSIIGKPIPDLKVYLLDKHRALIPIGIPGEIFVGGAGVGRGYLGRDELTAERFMSDPFSDTPQAKLYRSGDLARWLPDGDLEYLGRIDNQVKLRGYRIELGEIEAVIGEHPAISQAIVMVREDVAGDKRLAAYVVAQQGVSVEAKELRGYLKDKLPDYMVPSAIVFLDVLPLTPNGKLDRRTLPAPNAVPRNDFIAPRTPVEDNIAVIWADVLGVGKVGVDDNFFDLGGHSLLATQVASRMRTVFKMDIPLRSLFEASTLEDLAAMIVRQQANQVSDAEMERLLADVEAIVAVRRGHR